MRQSLKLWSILLILNAFGLMWLWTWWSLNFSSTYAAWVTLVMYPSMKWAMCICQGKPWTYLAEKQIYIHCTYAYCTHEESEKRKKVRLVRLDSLDFVYVTLSFSYISRFILSTCSTILIVCIDCIFILWVWGSVLAEIWHNPLSVYYLKWHDAR